MRNLLKYAGVSLLVVGLAACDGKSEKPAESNDTSSQTSQTNSSSQPASSVATPNESSQAQPATPAAAPATPAAESSKPESGGGTVSLLDGKVSFTLPEGVVDKSDKLGAQAKNMHVYADGSGQQAIIVIEGDNTDDSLEDLAKRMIEQQRIRAPQIQVITNKAITVSGQPMQQLDTIITVANQSALSSLVMGKVGGKLLTLQITVPADDQQKAQERTGNFLKTLQVK